MTTVSYRDFTGTGADNYERHFVPAIGRPVAELTLDVLDPRPGERVLDVACGTGIVARLVAERVGPTGAVTGIDISPEMIDTARAAAPSLDWRTGDAAALPFDDGTFDATVCQMGLMFVPDRVTAIAEMARVTAAGGRVVLVTPGAIQPFFEAMERAIVDHINPDLGGFVRAVFSIHDPDALASLAGDGGLADVAASVRTVSPQLPPPADFLWQYINLTPMGPFVAQASADAQAAMERQFVDAVAALDGPLAQPMVVVTGLSR